MPDEELNVQPVPGDGALVRGKPEPARAAGSELAPADGIKTRPTPTYLTAAQVAEMLQLDPATVYRWAAQDATMPATRVAGTIRFHAAALDRWLASRTQKSRR